MVVNTTTPLLSIVVPFYNADGFLAKCIGSILNQTLRDFELILVNDGSTDNSLDICKKYAGKDSRVTVISQENQGVSAARNAGLDVASGKYVGFVDSDDFLCEAMYERLIEAIELYNADVAICGYAKVLGDGTRRTFVGDSHRLLAQQEVVDDLFSATSYVENYVFNKVFRARIIGNVRFDQQYQYCEDMLFFFKCILGSQRFVYVPEAHYCYVQREGSAVRGNPNILPQGIKIRREILEIVKEKFPESYHKGLDKLINAFLDVSLRMLNGNASRSKHKEIRTCLKGLTRKMFFCTEIPLKLKVVFSLAIIHPWLYSLASKKYLNDPI